MKKGWTGSRGRVRRALAVWGVTPGFTVPHTHVRVRAADGVVLAGSYLRGPRPADATADVPAVVVVHGFAGHRRKPAYLLLSERLSDVAAVLALDLRGHGGSQGACTLGDREALDVEAAAVWLRGRGHDWVGVIGASLGGAAAIRAAGTAPPGTFDAACSISAVAEWGLRATPAMRSFQRLVTDGWFRRVVGLTLHVRIAGRWAAPPQPVDIVGRITPAPLLIVHGVDDHYYGPEQAQLLYDAAGEPRELWLEPEGFGHAEDGFTPAFVQRLSAAVAGVHRHSRWPSRASSRGGPGGPGGPGGLQQI